MTLTVEAGRLDPKAANIAYHDWEADSYDDKWAISFDRRCTDYVRQRIAAVAGTAGWPYGRALEIGCGTGFFGLNAKLAGVLTELEVCDISPGMVAAARRTADRLGFTVGGQPADAEALPYDDDSFDLVVGHAFLHHIPDVALALREVLRVLRPGGRFVVGGEPTRYGDRVARWLSRLTWRAVSFAGRLPGGHHYVRSPEELAASSQDAALESVVDLHTFAPADLARLATSAGAVDVQVRTEELTAAWFGWPARTFEAAVRREMLPTRYYFAIYHTWQRLSALDEVLARVVPAGLFYNASITGVRPPPPVVLAQA